MTALRERLRALCEAAAKLVDEQDQRDRITDLVVRIDGPLRVAFAGRIKAGKSTLLNALIGERVAPTDTAECTRFVTWYEYGPQYAVHARLFDGTQLALPFQRHEDALAVEIAPAISRMVDELVVRWPSSRLKNFTFVDTPGYDSLAPEVGDRSARVLVPQDGRTRIDAMLFLMRHAHTRDADFLEAFRDSQASGSPVNALAVLSHADTVGAGRLDAMESALRIARRYANDQRIRSFVSSVLPACGLLAETSVTLTQSEHAAMKTVANEPQERLQRMLLSADGFCEDADARLTRELREQLMSRLGMFGVRRAVSMLAAGEADTAAALAGQLRSASNVQELESLLERCFGARSQRLIARSVLNELRSIAAITSAGVAIRDLVEEAEAAMHELAEVDLLERALLGEAGFGPKDLAEIERLTQESDPRIRLGVSGMTNLEDALGEAVRAIERWRLRGADPMLSESAKVACHVAARSYEGIYAELGRR